MAGVSLDWYTRIEQGRGERPSPSVLDALAETLRLSRDERHHLYALARAEHPPLNAPADEHPDVSLLRVLESLPSDLPAMLLGRRWDVLAWNSPLQELLVPFEDYPPERLNLVALTFLDDAYRKRYADWTAVAEETVANFRASVARHLELPDVQQLVGELTDASPDFARWWVSHEVREKTSGVKAFRLGDRTVRFRYDTLTSPSTADQRLVIYTREDR